MMDGVVVEPSIVDVGQQSANAIHIRVGTREDLMLCEVTNLLVSLSPLPPRSMAEESQLHEDKRSGDMHNGKQFQSHLQIACQEVNKGNLQQRRKIKPLRHLTLKNWDDDYLQKNVKKSCKWKDEFLYQTFQNCVLWHYLEIVDHRLQGLNFIVKESIGIRMVAQAMHLLPFAMRKASQHPEVTKRMIFHVYEVMSNSQQRVDGESTEEGQDI